MGSIGSKAFDIMAVAPRLGFSRTYLGLVAVVDGRQYEGDTFFFRGTSDASYRRILDVAGTVDLMEAVGLLYVEIVQPVERPIAKAAMVSAAIAKEARPQQQSEHLTTRILNYFREWDA